MGNPNREIDKTHLSIDNAESRGFIHRDYIAHCLRWSHVCKHMHKFNFYKRARILDVGCGKELPLLKTLYTSRLSPMTYTGFDVNRINCSILPNIEAKMGIDNVEIWDKTDFSEADINGLGPFNIITCFEVLEHVTPKKCIKILKRIHSFMNEYTVCFISTPVWNGKAAANHINEMTYGALGALLENLKFNIVDHWGTFASQRDIEPQIENLEISKIYNRLKEYYDSNYISTIFAPLFPGKSRNILWKLRKQNEFAPIKEFFPLKMQKHQWSQHKNWEDLNVCSH